MSYFRIPRLGAFLAFPLNFNSCLSSNSFDALLEDTLRFNKAKAEQDKEIEAKTQAYNDSLKEKENQGEDTTELTTEYEVKFRGIFNIFILKVIKSLK
jgi:hypothetical protein